VTNYGEFNLNYDASYRIKIAAPPPVDLPAPADPLTIKN
jgi:hypothetical protein